VKRDRGTALLTTVLTAAAQADGRPLSMLDEIHVFGSFARGALEPHDVDVDVELTADEQFRGEFAGSLSRGRDPFTSVRHALLGTQRGVQFRFQELSELRAAEIETTLLWRRGEQLDTALARLHAIKPDPEAGRSPRDGMLPAFEGIDRHVPRPVREMLSNWAGKGAVTVERIDLPALEATGEIARDTIKRRWGATSVLRRAAHSALAHLEQQHVPAEQIHLHGHDVVRDSDTPYFVGFQWRYANAIHQCLTRWGGNLWLEIPHPTASGPLIAVRIDVTDRETLTAQRAMW
jgi:hypothetical protein